MELRAADIFCDHFAIRTRGRDEEVLADVGASLARLPYENLTKLIKKQRFPAGPERRRLPSEVMTDHLAVGAGGTCFALTRLVGEVLARLGIDSWPVLCDTPHRPANHCASVVLCAGREYLLDPGYLVFAPVALDEPGDRSGRLQLRTVAPDVVELWTFGKLRYRLHRQPASPAVLEAAWDASFDWTMMRGAHLCVPNGDGYAYMHNRTLCLRGGSERGNVSLKGREGAELARRFGLRETVVSEAFAVVDRLRAESRGSR
jgi:hypothetical protein